MYRKNGLLMAEPGMWLRRGVENGYALPDREGQETAVDEAEVNIGDMVVEGDEAYWNGRLMRLRLPKPLTYGGLKTAMVRKRYSNDDQVALMLNRDDSDEDRSAYEHMQKWREYAAKVARRVMYLTEGKEER